MIRVIILLLNFFSFAVYSQNSDLLFKSYGTLNTWSGVAVDWRTNPKVHIYDTKIYKGHSEFVAKGLGRKIRFAEFKKLSRSSKSREFLPFFLYDLKDKPFKTSQGNLNWALRLENYNYDDKPDQLAEDIIQLRKMISALDKNFTEKGLIILYEEDKNPLNISKLGKFFDKAGEPYSKLSQLISHVDGKKISVLNSGVAYGLLKLVKNDKQLEKLEPHHIAVLDYSPIYIPPVAGILSLKPQTPLSHVNLLAKNRGTFNAYIMDISAIPNFKKLIGKYVKLHNEEDKIFLKPITKKEALSNKSIFVKKTISVPEIKLDAPDIIALSGDNEKYLKTQYIGAKATNYYLLQKSLPNLTKDGFAISFRSYLESIKGEPETLIETLLKSKNKLSKQDLTKALEKIRSSIQKSNSLPSELVPGIRKFLEKFPAKSKIRLRSSTNNEDLPDFNGAGLYESKGFKLKEDDEKLKSKILSVYSSLWSEKAFQEREFFGVDHKKVGMAILVHEAFQKEVGNGVILTNVDKNNSIRIVINAQSGEYSVTNPKEEMIPEAFVFNPETELIETILSESSISPVFIKNTLNESLLKTLGEATVKLHKQFTKERTDSGDTNQYGVDIEFKIMHEKGKNKLYFKQVRLLKY